MQVATLVVPRAHAAAVTSLQILDSPDPNLVTIATTGLDQQLKIWTLHIDSAKTGTEGFSIERARRKFTPVADPSNLLILEHDRGNSVIMICGVGIDVWRHEAEVESAQS